MPATKNKIIEISERLFFEHGIANIRLQQIADGAGISVGNLAYHFKNKDAIVQAVYEDLFSQMANILSQYTANPKLAGFNQQFSALYNFYQQNNFTFNNSWEIDRNYPEIQKEWLSATNKVLLQLQKRIEFNIKEGVMRAGPWKNAAEKLAQHLLLAINCWIPQQMLRGKPVTEELFCQNLWHIIWPFLTEKGIAEYEQTISPINR